MRSSITICLISAVALLFAACSQDAGPAPTNGPSEPATAADAKSVVGGIDVIDPWIAVPPNGARVAAGYMTIRNAASEEDTLVSASSSVAAYVEIHEMGMEGGMMRMRALKQVEAPAEGVVALAPGGLHLMLIDVRTPLKSGDTVPLTLMFERAGMVEVVASVRDRRVANKNAGGGHTGHSSP